MSRWGRPTKNKRRRDPRYFLNESEERLDEVNYRDLFGRAWGDEWSWKRVTDSSIVGVWEAMGKPDPARFIGDLPYDWQKPKVTKALESAGVDVSGAGAASEPAAAKPGSITRTTEYIPSDAERASGQGRHLKK